MPICIWEPDQVTASFIIEFSPLLTALTVGERWNAMRRFPRSSAGNGLFEIVALIVLAGLILLLIRLQSSRSKQERHGKNGVGAGNRRSFSDHARHVGLTERQCSLLLLVAKKASLKQPESIFSMSTAFDRGVDLLIKERLNNGEVAGDVEQVMAELSFLRERLDFRIPPSSLIASTAVSTLSTRQIPVGRKLYVTAAGTWGAKSIEGSVVGNSDSELKVKLAEAVDAMAGDQWSVRCPSGTSIWEFDTDVLEYRDRVMDLNHTSNIKLASRRRFPRVPVRMPAFIMPFSFAVIPEDSLRLGSPARSPETDTILDEKWEPPEFAPAIVTELAGPGMRIESRIHASMGDHLLIVLGLDDNESVDPGNDQGGTWQRPSRVLEDTVIVRHVKRVPDRWSMAVELVGSSDANVDELIHAMNAAEAMLHAGERAVASERELESALVQGDRDV